MSLGIERNCGSRRRLRRLKVHIRFIMWTISDRVTFNVLLFWLSGLMKRYLAIATHLNSKLICLKMVNLFVFPLRIRRNIFFVSTETPVEPLASEIHWRWRDFFPNEDSEWWIGGQRRQTLACPFYDSRGRTESKKRCQIRVRSRRRWIIGGRATFWVKEKWTSKKRGRCTLRENQNVPLLVPTSQNSATKN